MRTATSFLAWATPAIGCSVRADDTARNANGVTRVTPLFLSGRRWCSAEPLARAVALLFRRVDDPLLSLCVENLGRHPREPVRGLRAVADTPPELANEICQDRPLFARHAVERRQRL